MNSFGTATLKLPLYDPRGTVAERARFRREAVSELARVNSFYCPSGRWPFRGWVLLARADYDCLDRYSTALQLEVGDPRRSDNVGTLKNLCVVQARCVTRGLAADVAALYLVELTDARGILHNKWFQFPTTTSYNVRAPAYPSTFYPATMNGGTTWTWATMVQDMWERMPLLGAWPGFPAGASPLGTPEGFWFSGVPAWPALCDVLDHLGLTVACDLTAAAPYTIVQPGAADATFAAAQTRYGSITSPNYCLEDDLEWIDVGAARVPATIKVLFRRRNAVYGTEETVRYDSPQWSTSAVYEVSASAPAAFASAVGTHYLWSDFTVRYDQDGAILAEDAAAAAAIAAEQVTEHFTVTYAQTLGYMTQTYAGALPFATGARVDGVSWYQDYRGGDRAGWRTQIVRGASPPWPGVWD